MESKGQSSRPDTCRGHSIDSLYAYFERWLTSLETIHAERDKRYEEKFRGLETATNIALAAVEKQTNAAFAANEKAILKTDEAQRSYNERSNEFRGQLKDQAERLMPRTESIDKFKVVEEKLEECKREIGLLRETQVSLAGRDVERVERRQTTQWTAGQVLSTIFALLGFGLAIAAMLIKSKP